MKVMQQITKYQAIDGMEFNSENQCRDYEELIDLVNKIMSALNPLPKDAGCDFSNGHSFVQQSASTFKLVKSNLLAVIKRFIDHRWVQQTIDDNTVHLSFVGRLVGEGNLHPLSNAWKRLSCIDKEYREWGQQYFAEHPEESKALSSSPINTQP